MLLFKPNITALKARHNVPGLVKALLKNNIHSPVYTDARDALLEVASAVKGQATASLVAALEKLDAFQDHDRKHRGMAIIAHCLARTGDDKACDVLVRV